METIGQRAANLEKLIVYNLRGLNMNKCSLVIVAILLSSHVSAQDQSCDDYPAYPGGEFQAVEGSSVPRIIATAEVYPFSSDRQDTADALREARMAANVVIARFIENTVSSNENIDSAVQSISEKTGDKTESSQIRIKTMFTSMSSNTAAVLRGVVPLGDCVSPGDKVMVTVGLKPETLAAAEGLSSEINDSLRRSPTQPSGSYARDENGLDSPSTSSSSNSAEQSRQDEAKGRSNSNRLKDF